MCFCCFSASAHVCVSVLCVCACACIYVYVCTLPLSFYIFLRRTPKDDSHRRTFMSCFNLPATRGRLRLEAFAVLPLKRMRSSRDAFLNQRRMCLMSHELYFEHQYNYSHGSSHTNHAPFSSATLLHLNQRRVHIQKTWVYEEKTRQEDASSVFSR